ncbi:hypothetical protein AB0K09_24025 [Streptomyces sp. NPDC049577]|uniref:hypothetical protein n=1 Tax=Streptomyces sp. NPDC049577 TaxID=3155153 RepID=UPI00342E0D7E
MTPYSLAFYLDVITTGNLLGVPPDAGPDEVTGLLGPEFAENRFGGRSMCRDHGLVEFFWDRPSPADPWTGHHFSLQVHRLARGGGSVVNENIRARYGRFGRHLPFEKLRRMLEKRGVPLVEVPEDGNAPEIVRYVQPRSRVDLYVVRSHPEWRTPPHNERIGDVRSIVSAG